MTPGAGFRPCCAVAGSVLIFAMLVERAGLPLATAATVFVAASGSTDFRPRSALMLAGGVALAITALFVVLLDQPLTIVPGL